MPVDYTVYVENRFIGEEDSLVEIQFVLPLNNPLGELYESVAIVFRELLNERELVRMKTMFFQTSHDARLRISVSLLSFRVEMIGSVGMRALRVLKLISVQEVLGRPLPAFLRLICHRIQGNALPTDESSIHMGVLR